MRKYILYTIATVMAGLIIISSCKTSELVLNKPGALLWAQNCTRCHYAPSPSEYSDKQWDIITTHMAVRANLTEIEKNKIIEFLSQSN